MAGGDLDEDRGWKGVRWGSLMDGETLDVEECFRKGEDVWLLRSKASMRASAGLMDYA